MRGEVNVWSVKTRSSMIDDRCDPKRILERLPVSVLEGEGWELRFIADSARAEEAAELYSQLGFDVHTEPGFTIELDGGCSQCALMATCQFTTIYTRRKRPGSAQRRRDE